jgi:hypothetical protein
MGKKKKPKDKCCKKYKDGKRCKKCPKRPNLAAVVADDSERI